MGSIVFVHGTGVREQSYLMTCNKLRMEIQQRLKSWTLLSCFWGEKQGARLQKGGASIPNYQSARAVGALLPVDEEIALWQLLYEDPFYELRLLVGLTGEPEELAPGQASPAKALKEKLEQLQTPVDLTDLLRRNLLDGVWSSALQEVIESPAMEDALDSMDSSAGESFRTAIAHAIVARTITLAEEQGIPSIDGQTRDRIVEYVVDELGGTERGLREMRQWAGDKLKGFALKIVTNKIERKRGVISDSASPVAGDIILYQTRGESILQFIRKEILSAPQPILILAHSLGGIICVDMLVKEKMPVEGLITVGSQAPLFYEIDSLTSLRYGEDLPSHFPRWLNFYDPHDFLSYIGEGVFPGKVEDVQVESNQPFPISHSGYWSVEAFWEKIVEFVG